MHRSDGTGSVSWYHVRMSHRFDAGRVNQSPLGNARASSHALLSCRIVSVYVVRCSCSACMCWYISYSIRLLRMDSRQDRAHKHNHRYRLHTLLTGPIDGGFGRCSEPPRAGMTSSRGTIGPRVYIIHIHTRPTVAWGAPPGAVGSILITLSYAATRSYHRAPVVSGKGRG